MIAGFGAKPANLPARIGVITPDKRTWTTYCQVGHEPRRRVSSHPRVLARSGAGRRPLARHHRPDRRSLWDREERHRRGGRGRSRSTVCKGLRAWSTPPGSRRRVLPELLPPRRTGAADERAAGQPVGSHPKPLYGTRAEDLGSVQRGAPPHGQPERPERAVGRTAWLTHPLGDLQFPFNERLGIISDSDDRTPRAPCAAVRLRPPGVGRRRCLGDSLTQLLDNTQVGVIDLDRRGRVVEANDRARFLLRHGNGLHDRDGFLLRLAACRQFPS